MNRRNVLLGLGTAAAGSGIVFGSGAFTQVQAERSVTIGIDQDSNALLALEASDDVASVYNSEETGELVIDTNELSDDNIGFNVGATVQIGETDTDLPEVDEATVVDALEGSSGTGAAFEVTNNFDTVAGDDDNNDELDIGINLEDVAKDSGGDPDSSLVFIGSEYDDDGDSPTNNKTLTVEDGSQVIFNDVPPGNEIYFAIRIETTSTTDPKDFIGEVTFRAGPNLADEFPTDATVSDGGIVNVTQDTTHTGIQSAEDEANQGDLIQVSGKFSESVTIDTEGLTLEAAEGASPTVDASGIDGGSIPVLVDGVDDVTVDDANIDFNSGIDVGANIPEYPEQDPSNFDLAVFTDESGLNGTKFEGDVGNTAFETIDEAAKNAGTDDSVLVFPGEYDFSAVDDDSSGTEVGLEWVSAAGPDGTRISFAGDPGIYLVEDRMKLQGFTFAGTDLGAQELVVIGANNVEFSHNIIEEGVEVGNDLIRITGGDNILLDSNEIRDSDGGGPRYPPYSIAVISETNSVKDLKIRNNLITGDIGDTAHIALTNASSPEIEHNTIRNAKGIQITEQEGNVGDVRVNRNLFEADGYGLVSTSSGDTINQLKNNHFVGTGLEVRLLDRDGLGSPDEDLDADNNWFGTEDRSDVIDNQIGDSGASNASITIDPFAGAPIDPDA